MIIRLARNMMRNSFSERKIEKEIKIMCYSFGLLQWNA